MTRHDWMICPCCRLPAIPLGGEDICDCENTCHLCRDDHAEPDSFDHHEDCDDEECTGACIPEDDADPDPDFTF